jgi:signal recognition particle subunit SEC65
MPREFPILPCPEHRFFMESLGFQFDEESWDKPQVTWNGHGFMIDKFKETDRPTLTDVFKAVAEQADAKAESRVRLKIRQALGI